MASYRRHKSSLLLAFTTAFSFACLSFQAGAASSSASNGFTATAEQKSVEQEVTSILAEEAMKKQIEASELELRSSPIARTPDGKRTLREGLMEAAGTAAFFAAVSDTSYPRLAWFFAAPRQWLGHRVPGSRIIVDNVNNMYRIGVIDGASTYQIHFRPTGPLATQVSITLYDNVVGEENRKLDETLSAYFVGKDTEKATDGSFTITIDPQPANDKKNRMQNHPQSKQLLIRETLSDWAKQSPMAISIKRVGGPEIGKPADHEELTRRAVSLLAAGTDTIVTFGNRFSPLPENGFSRVNVRAMEGKNDEKLRAVRPDGKRVIEPSESWGFVSTGRFNVGDDEALVVTVDPLDTEHLGLMLTSPWYISLEHVHASGSLNNGQLARSKDGTYTFVVSPNDPGVQNWLDTSGLHQGGMFIRWQQLTRPVENPDSVAIRKVKLVKLADLRAELPSDMRYVSKKERKKLLGQRERNYKLRCGGTPCEVSNAVGLASWE